MKRMHKQCLFSNFSEVAMKVVQLMRPVMAETCPMQWVTVCSIYIVHVGVRFSGCGPSIVLQPCVCA